MWKVILTVSLAIGVAQGDYISEFYRHQRVLRQECNFIEKTLKETRASVAVPGFDVMYAGTTSVQIMPSATLSIVTPRTLRFSQNTLEQRLSDWVCKALMQSLQVSQL